MQPERNLIVAAMNQAGYEQWQPTIDVPNLNRPRCRPVELPGTGKIAAVLLLLYMHEQKNELSLVLTRRRNDMSKHPGQIALPGGRCDEGETIERTAVRETVEEIGVREDEIEILGRLSQVYVPPSDFTVTPFVGWHRGTPSFEPAEYEVAEILEVPVKKLLDPATLVMGEVSTWNKNDPGNPHKITAPFYDVASHQVWGATACMLDEFLDRVRKVQK